MKTEILFPTIERWHCIDLVLENMRLAEKPDDIQVLAVVSGSEKYRKYVEGRLKSIFNKVRIVKNYDTPIEHSELRKIHYENFYDPDPKISVKKLLKVFHTYSLIKKNIDKTADYYWFIEDDTLFPLDVYKRYMAIMDGLRADIVSGQSYYWHTLDRQKRNFWKISNSDDKNKPIKLDEMGICDEGIIKLGATGLGNVLCKKEAVTTWNPESYLYLRSGADISFFYNAQNRDLKAYGIWEVFLPHITKYQNGDIEIRGRIDKSIIQLVNKFYDARRNT
jgi:hypothetical protein